MKFNKMLFVIVAVLLLTGNSFAQYQMTLLNGAKTSLTQFEFDVYIKSTGPDLDLTSYTISLTYPAALANGGTLGFEYINGTTALSNTPSSAQIVLDGGESDLVAGSNYGSDIITATSVKIGRFRITNTVSFADVPVLLNWDFNGLILTDVNDASGGITNPANHFNLLSPYQLSLENDVQTSNKTYEFDVFVTGSANFSMTGYQFVFSYNTAAVNGGTLSLSYVAASTALTSCKPTSLSISNDGSVSNIFIATTPGNQSVSTTPIKVGRFILTNTVSFALLPMNLQWDFSGTLVTQMKISSANLTNPSNHVNLLGNSPLPVELTSFLGKSVNDKVLLNWETASEIRNTGFDIERCTVSNGKKSNWSKVAFVKGSGNSNISIKYNYTDKELNSGEYIYRLKQIDVDGSFVYSEEVNVNISLPVVFRLDQNYPNPFNPSTTVKYQIPVESRVTLRIFNAIGEQVAQLFNDVQNAGFHNIQWNASGFGSGLYLVNLVAESTQDGQRFSKTIKIMLVK